MKAILLTFLAAALFSACLVKKKTTDLDKKNTNTGYFIVSTKSGQADTLKGIVENTIRNWKVGVFPMVFKLEVFDSGKNISVEKNINIHSIRYALIKYPSNLVNLEYRLFQDTVWQILRKRDNIEMLYSSYDKYVGIMDYNSEQGVVDNTVNNTFDIIRLLKNGERINDIPPFYLNKRSLYSFIKSQYLKNGAPPVDKKIALMLDYIIDQESKKQNKD